MKNRDIYKIFKYEYILVGIISSIISIINIRVLIAIINVIVKQVLNINKFLSLSVNNTVYIFVLSFLVCSLASKRSSKKINNKSLKELLK